MGELEFPERVRRLLAARSPWKARDADLRPASVLLPLFASEPGGPPQLWLVRRSIDMRTHSGQVALPGGKHEPSDVDLLTTALRESHEEIGLVPSEVDVLGPLDDYATHTGFVITPYVGWVSRPFIPAPHAREVARVFAVPLTTFEREPHTITMATGSSKRIVLSYEAAGETIWGITAAILRRFSQLLAT
jgi:8-oxo-dGTP pyrophosphatase MutT (NUDIX family)